MTKRPAGGQSILIASPLRYASLSVSRRWGENVSVYVALAIAVALPIVTLLFRAAIAAQGAELGGRESAREFDTAAGMIAGIAALVGLLQISLVLGRVLARRAAEYKLLLAIVMSPGQVLRLTLWESAFHAVIGWCAGSMIAALIFSALRLVEQASLPTLPIALEIFGIGLSICVAGVFIPSLLSHARRSWLRSFGGQFES